MRTALGPALAGRAARLKVLALVYDENLRETARRLPQTVGSGSTYSGSPVADAKSRSRLERFPDLTGAVFVPTGRLGDLAGWKGLLNGELPKIRREARGGKAFVYGVRAPRSGRFIYVFVGPDADSIDPLIPAFLKDPAPCEGICIRAGDVARAN